MEPVEEPTDQGQGMSDVTEALQGLADGESTLDEVEALFREREWPRRSDDQGGHLPGSFAEVADAYSAGLINHDQYVRLAAAATEAMRAQSGIGDSDE
jgi:hypothetical protein